MSKKILVVDDNPNVVKAIRFVLEQEGYEVISCGSGPEALVKLRETKPALVLLDIMMPGLDGIDTLRCIKALDSEIPVIMVTAVQTEEESRKAMGAGAYDYITKPIDIEYLKTSVLTKLGFS